jgi:hypothetical protein
MIRRDLIFRKSALADEAEDDSEKEVFWPMTLTIMTQTMK